MAKSRHLDAIGQLTAATDLNAYTFVVLDPSTQSWRLALAADSVSETNLVGVVQQDAVAGETVNVMTKGQTKLQFDAAIISTVGSNAGKIGAAVGIHATAGSGIVGVASTAASVRANVYGVITDEVAAADSIGSIYLTA